MTENLPPTEPEPSGDNPPAPDGSSFPPPPAPAAGFAFPPPPPPPGGHPAGVRVRHRRRGMSAAAAVVVLAGTVAASAAITHELWPAGGSTRTASFQLPAPTTPGSGSSGSTGSGSTDTSSIAAKVDPALVDINVTFGYQQAAGAGTGIVLTSNGEILTNNHVINGATSISVTDIGNGRTYSANVVGYDPSNDVAVVQLVGASGLQTASIGNSNNVKVGDTVVAVGNAGGSGGTPSAAGGSVTALNQAITASDQLDGVSENLTNLIETNADVQSGDSGGSLVNSSGQVVGMDTAAASSYSLQAANGTTNQGYAIPINQALSIARQIEAGNASSTVHVGPTAFLGVLIGSGSSSPFGGGFGSGSTSGATIAGVTPGGAAATAGLAAGDIITSIDGQSVSSSSTLSQIIGTDKPGQSLQVGWTDANGVAHTTTVTLQSGPAA